MNAALTEESAINDRIDLDRSDWELMSFGDVALKQRESVDRENTDLTRYIAGEHMGSEDLHLRQWGELGDDYLGPAFTRKFSEGDILYGSRRTYLRKVAVAHFHGITANTTFVIKPNEELILKELLPFVMLSEGFAQHSIRNSKGSVNPYINWKDIADYEFLLPPKDQQAKLAKLLCAADKNIESILALEQSHLKYVDSLCQAILTRGVDSDGKPRERNEDELRKTPAGLLPADWTAAPITDYAVEKGIVNGPFGSDLLTSELQPEGVPVIYVRDVKPGRYDRVSTVCVSQEKADQLAFCDVQQGDIVVAKVGDPPCDAAPYLISERSIVTQDVIRIRPGPETNGHFLAALLNSPFARSAVKRITIGGGRTRVSLTQFKTLVLPKPPLAEQARIGNVLREIDSLQSNLNSKLYHSKRVLKSLINQIF